MGSGEKRDGHSNAAGYDWDLRVSGTGVICPMVKHRSFRLTPIEYRHGLAPQSPLMRSFKRLLGGLALVGFMASLIVHAATLFGVDPPRLSWLLHVGVFLVFIPMILTWRRLVLSRQTGWSMAEAKRAHGELFWKSLACVPIWVKSASILCCAYSMAMGMAVGMAGRLGGKTIGSFSGGWLFFYLMPAVFFFWVEPRAREIQEMPNADQPQTPLAADKPGG